MGENYLLEQAKNARKRRDRSLEDMGKPTLLIRPDLIDVSYPARPVEGSHLESGEILLAFPSDAAPHIDLARGNRKVGVIEGEAARELHDALRQPGTAGSIVVRLSEVAPLSGVAEARIVKDE